MSEVMKGLSVVPGGGIVSRIEAALTDTSTMLRFAAACSKGESGVASFAEGLAEECGCDAGETLVHLLSLVSALLPDSPAAREIASSEGEASPAPADEYTARFDPDGDILDLPDLPAERDFFATPREVEDAVHAILSSDEALLERFERACGSFRENPMRTLVTDVYRYAKNDRALRKDLHDRTAPEERAGAYYAALCSIVLEERQDSRLAATLRVREMHAASGIPSSRGGREHVLAVLAASPSLLSALEAAVVSGKEDRLLVASRSVYRRARDAGMEVEPEHFSDHVWAVLSALFPNSPGAGFDRWLQALDDTANKLLTDEDLDDALSQDERFEYVARALELVTEGDRAGARHQYRQMVYRARKMNRTTA